MSARNVEQKSDRQFSHDIAVNDLYHDQSAVIGHDIESLGFDIGVLVSPPTQVILCHFGITSSLGLLSNGLDRIGAILWLLGASNTGQTGDRTRRRSANLIFHLHLGGEIVGDIRRLEPVHDERIGIDIRTDLMKSGQQHRKNKEILRKS